MPSFNARETIAATLNSVVTQTYVAFELIVVDDGSTDGTPDLIDALRDPRVRLIRAPHSGLPGAARNRAASACTGEFVAFLDADDLWVPEKLERQIQALDGHPDIGLMHTAAYHLCGDRVEPQPGRCPAREPLWGRRLMDALLRSNFIYTPSVMVRRRLLDATGWFDEDPALRGPEDFDLWLRLCEAGVLFAYLDEPLLLYRVRADSVSRNPAGDLTGSLAAIAKACRRNPPLRAIHATVLAARFHGLHLARAEHRLRAGEQGGWVDLAHALWWNPSSGRAWAWLALAMAGSRGRSVLLGWHARRRGQSAGPARV